MGAVTKSAVVALLALAFSHPGGSAAEPIGAPASAAATSLGQTSPGGTNVGRTVGESYPFCNGNYAQDLDQYGDGPLLSFYLQAPDGSWIEQPGVAGSARTDATAQGPVTTVNAQFPGPGRWRVVAQYTPFIRSWTDGPVAQQGALTITIPPPANLNGEMIFTLFVGVSTNPLTGVTVYFPADSAAPDPFTQIPDASMRPAVHVQCFNRSPWAPAATPDGVFFYAEPWGADQPGADVFIPTRCGSWTFPRTAFEGPGAC